MLLHVDSVLRYRKKHTEAERPVQVSPGHNEDISIAELPYLQEGVAGGWQGRRRKRGRRGQEGCERQEYTRTE